ncbi:MAG: tRNA (cytidine(34)-2'-O)-methyltransferase [Pseudomonadota bacterium]
MNIVLLSPEIPQNTGNIARLSVATNSRLFLVGKLGFSIDDKAVRRAGLDYWKDLKLTSVETIEEIVDRVPDKYLFFFSKKAKKVYTEVSYPKESYLIFGCETIGLPDYLFSKFPERFFKIPISSNVRSLNLANAVGIVVYESIRQNGFDPIIEN